MLEAPAHCMATSSVMFAETERLLIVIVHVPPEADGRSAVGLAALTVYDPEVGLDTAVLTATVTV
jgi:hypothetical protein